MISKYRSYFGKPLMQMMYSERGLALTEALVTMAITGMVIAAFLFSMSTTSKAVIISQRLVTAENLAKSQIEYLRSQPYDEAHDPPQYGGLPAGDIPDGFTVVTISERLDPKGDGLTTDDGLQKLTVVVNYDGAEAFRLEDYRMKR
jgi:type II secretory pathway pseudopilin PulG